MISVWGLSGVYGLSDGVGSGVMRVARSLIWWCWGCGVIGFLEGAGRQGCTAGGVGTAMAHLSWVRRGFGRSRAVCRAWVGPAMDGGLIGVMVHIGPTRDVVVFRCMRPGDGFRWLMEGAETP